MLFPPGPQPAKRKKSLGSSRPLRRVGNASTDSLVSVIILSSVCRLPGLFDHFGDVYIRSPRLCCLLPLRYIVVFMRYLAVRYFRCSRVPYI